MTIDPGASGGPPVLNLRNRSISFSSFPRLVLGLVIALACFGAVGWLFLGSIFGAPFWVAAPMSVFFGMAFVAYEVKQTWRGYAVAAAFFLAGVAVLFAWWAS